VAVVQYTYTQSNTGKVRKQTIHRTQKYIEQHKKYIEQHNSIGRVLLDIYMTKEF